MALRGLVSDGVESCGYSPKTRAKGKRPYGTSVSFIALTERGKSSTSSASGFVIIILRNVLRKGLW